MDAADQENQLRRLVLAEEALARTRKQTARQRDIVAKLESAGQDVALARHLLATFEATEANHERVLITLLRELADRGWKVGCP